MRLRHAVISLVVGAGAPLSAQQSAVDPDAFVRAHCVQCHGTDANKGKLDLTQAESDPTASLWRWRRLAERVQAGEMPPPDADLPAPAERTAFVAAIAAKLRAEVPALPINPGRVTVRRLSRSQWANCMRDLFGLELSTASFPVDDLGYGFDTIGDALTFSTLHLETYLAAAGEVAALVLHGEDPTQPTQRRFEAEAMELTEGPSVGRYDELAHLNTRGTLLQEVHLPRDGVYRLRILAGADQAGDEPAKMGLQLDGRGLDTFDVEERRLLPFELTAPLLAGRRRFELTFLNDFYAPENPDPTRRDRNLWIDALVVIGPLDARPVPMEQRWLQAGLPTRGDDATKLRAFTVALLAKLWRRPPSDDEVARLTKAGQVLLRAGERLVLAQRLVLQAALASPHFLFRGEMLTAGATTGSVVPLSGWALATRLSFFLWASAPDDRLLELARRGKLGERSTLLPEVERLLADPRADRLASEFAAMWLELRSLGDRTPDPARFPGFDDELRASMRRETELLFLAVLRERRDVRELLDCDFTHVDARLAAFYGLPAPPTPGFSRIELPPSHRERGGVLGHASVLAVTSNPTRTSPVKRGKWILENLLGQAPPPPPPGNDSLANEGRVDSSKSFREQLGQHRERAACAACHVRMDALGFTLERYDAIGRHREADAGGVIDCSGQLPDGTLLLGLPSLKATLRADAAFVQTLAQKLFVYALGRDLRPVDHLRLAHAVGERLQGGRVTLADLVLLVVQDDAFLSRSVEGAR